MEEEGSWASLPFEIKEHVWTFLPPKAAFRIQIVCKTWRDHLKDATKSYFLWKSLYDLHYGGPKEDSRTWKDALRIATKDEPQGRSPIEWAANCGHYQLVERCLAADSEKMYPEEREKAGAVIFAARRNDFKLLKRLLQDDPHGIDDLVSYFPCRSPRWGAAGEAAKYGHLEILRHLIEFTSAGVSHTNMTRLLKRAIKSSRLDVVRYLVEQKGARLDAVIGHPRYRFQSFGNLGTRSALEISLNRGKDLSVAEYLVSLGHKSTVERLLTVAMAKESIEAVDFVLRQWDEEDDRWEAFVQPLQDAARFGKERFFLHCISPEICGRDPVMQLEDSFIDYAIKGERLAIVKKCVELGADINYNTPLAHALRCTPHVARWLLDHGADPCRVVNSDPKLNLLHYGIRYTKISDSPDSEQVLLVKKMRERMISDSADPIMMEQVKQGKRIDSFDIPLEDKTALTVAVAEKRVHLVEALLDAGASVNYPEAKGFTPLFVAISQRTKKIVRMLLDRGADPNLCVPLSPLPPLAYAASYGRAGICRHLLLHGAAIDRGNPLHCALAYKGTRDYYKKKVKMVKILLQEWEEKVKDTVALEVKDGKGFNAFELFCATLDEDKKNRKLGKMLMKKKGAKVTARALIGALRTNSVSNCYFLLDQGQDIEKEALSFALIEASFFGNLEVIQRLVEKGADVDFRNEGRLADSVDPGDTPLIAAVRGEAGVRVCKYLLEEARANANIMNDEGETALDVAKCDWTTSLAILDLLALHSTAKQN